MAQFKRAFGSGESGSGLADGFGLDSTTLAAFGDATTVYWPLIAGAVVLILLIIKGDARAMIPVAGVVMLLQAWQSGLLQ